MNLLLKISKYLKRHLLNSLNTKDSELQNDQLTIISLKNDTKTAVDSVK
jgi:hypothetical protein